MREPLSLTSAEPAPPAEGEIPPMGISPCSLVQYQNPAVLYPATTAPLADTPLGVRPVLPSRCRVPPPASAVEATEDARTEASAEATKVAAPAVAPVRLGDSLATVMEGRSRPGFFDGVMTVVLKL